MQASPVQHGAQGQHLIIRLDCPERNLVPFRRALQWDAAVCILATLLLLFLPFGDFSLWFFCVALSWNMPLDQNGSHEFLTPVCISLSSITKPSNSRFSVQLTSFTMCTFAKALLRSQAGPQASPHHNHLEMCSLRLPPLPPPLPIASVIWGWNSRPCTC